MPTIRINHPDFAADIDADGFAAEQTLQRIAFNIEALRQASGAKLDTKSQKALNREAGKAAKTVKKAGASFEQAGHGAGIAYAGLVGLERLTTSIGQSFKKAASGISGSGAELGAGISAAGGLIASGIGIIGKGLSSTASMFGSTGAAVGKFGSVIVGAGVAGFSALVGVVAQTATDFGKLQQAGGLFGGSLGTVRQVAEEAGLTLTQFSNVFRKNTKTFSMFAGATTQGALGFGRLNKSVKNLYAGDFLRLGIGYEEMAERNAESVAAFALAGMSVLNMKNGVELVATRTKDLAIQQKLLSGFLGTTLEQEREKQKAFTQDINMRALMMGASDKTRLGMQELDSWAKETHPGLKNWIAQIYNGGRATTAAGLAMETQFSAMTGPLKEHIRGLKSGAKGPEDFISMLNKIDPTALEAQLRQAADLTNIMYVTGKDFGAYGKISQEGIVGMENLVIKLKGGVLGKIEKDIGALGKDPDATTKTFIKTTENLQKAAVKVQAAINKLLFQQRHDLDIMGNIIGSGRSAVEGLGELALSMAEKFRLLSTGVITTTSAFEGLLSFLRTSLPESVLNLIPGLAAGGPVTGGKPYWVGEGGKPELFVPKTNGYVVADPALRFQGAGQTANIQDRNQLGTPISVIEKMMEDLTKGLEGDITRVATMQKGQVKLSRDVESAILALPNLMAANTDAINKSSVDTADSLYDLQYAISS